MTTCTPPPCLTTEESVRATEHPQNPAINETAPPGESEIEGAPRAEKVLLLEDDPAFKEVIETFLTETGYEVRTVKSGVEGIREILASDFMVILCDMVMPTISGDMFYRAVERSRPHLCQRFIFMTGHRGDSNSNDFIKRVNGVVVLKPFHLDDLLNAVCLIETRRRFAKSRDTGGPGVATSPVEDAETDRPMPAAFPAVEDHVAATGGPLPPDDQVRSAPEPTLDARAVAQPILRTLLGLVLFVVLFGAPLAWYISVSKRTNALALDHLDLETNWTTVSKQLEEAETVRTRIQNALQVTGRLEKERSTIAWTPALRSVVQAAGEDIELLDIYARGEPDDPGVFQLRIGGSCTGQMARAQVDRFRQALESKLLQSNPLAAVKVHLASLEDEPDSSSMPPDQQKVVFTILARNGKKQATAEEGGEGR